MSDHAHDQYPTREAVGGMLEAARIYQRGELASLRADLDQIRNGLAERVTALRDRVEALEAGQMAAQLAALRAELGMPDIAPSDDDDDHQAAELAPVTEAEIRSIHDGRIDETDR